MFLGKLPQGMDFQGPGLYWGGVESSTFKAGEILRRTLGQGPGWVPLKGFMVKLGQLLLQLLRLPDGTFFPLNFLKV